MSDPSTASAAFRLHCGEIYFQTTFKNTGLADITAIEVVDTSGQTAEINPREHFPSGQAFRSHPPVQRPSK
jgi:hypothetical protein